MKRPLILYIKSNNTIISIPSSKLKPIRAMLHVFHGPIRCPELSCVNSRIYGFPN